MANIRKYLRSGNPKSRTERTKENEILSHSFSFDDATEKNDDGTEAYFYIIVEAENNKADINQDGIIDKLDVIALERHVAGWKGYRTLPYTGKK